MIDTPTKRPSLLAKTYHRTFSLGGMKEHTSKILPFLNRPGGKFVEIGARDGGSESLTLYLEKALGWQGILVEPWPHLFHKCRKKRRRSISLNVAAVDHFLHDSFIEVIGKPPEISIRKELKREAMERFKGRPILPPNLVKKRGKHVYYITTNRIESILTKAHFEHDFELLALNLLGYENTALEGMNFLIHKPTFILARVADENSNLPSLPLHYEKVATSRHSDNTTLALFRYAEYGAN